MADLTDLSIYLHIPFCAKKCSYCDFFSIAGSSNALLSLYVDTLIENLKKEVDRLRPDSIESIFIGGGTPTALPEEALSRLLGAITETVGSVDEFSIEANPESLSAPILDVLIASSVDRISLGVQSLNDSLLAWLDRPAGIDAVLNAWELLDDKWSDRFSMDFIAALPRKEGELEQELIRAAANGAGHLSVYELTVEKGTALAADKNLLASLPERDTSEDEWNRILKCLSEEGLERYEVSNFTGPGEECLHNIRYWEMKPYLGLGPGAASSLPSESGCALRIENPRDLLKWIDNRGGFSRKSELSPEELALEHFMMGLRLAKGLSGDRFASIFGINPESLIPRAYERWYKSGHLLRDTGYLRTVGNGMDLIDSILSDIAGELSPEGLSGFIRWPAS